MFWEENSVATDSEDGSETLVLEDLQLSLYGGECLPALLFKILILAWNRLVDHQTGPHMALAWFALLVLMLISYSQLPFVAILLPR